MKLSLGQKTIAVFGAGLLIFAVVSAISYISIVKLVAAAEARKYANDILHNLDAMISTLKDVDISHRDFAVTGRKNALRSHRIAVKKLNEEMTALQALLASDPEQQKRLIQLNTVIGKNLRFSDEVINARATRGHLATDRLIRSGTDRQLMNRALSITAEIGQEEERHRQEFDDRVNAATRKTIALILSGNVAAVAIFVLFGIFTQRELSQRKQTEKALGETEERFRLLVEGVKDYAIIMLDVDGRVASWNEGAERINGFKADEIIGKHFSLLYPEEDIILGKPEQALKTAETEGRFEEEGWRVHRDGTRYWAHVIITALKDDAGRIRGFSKVTRDITERKLAEESMRKLSMSVEQATDLVVLTDDKGKIEYINKAVEDISGYNRDEIIGKSREVWQSGLNHENTFTEMWEALRSGRPFQTIFTNRRKNGELFYVYEVITPLKDVKGVVTHYVSTGRDITHQKSMEEKIEYLAYYDALTGIPNRALFIDRLTQGIARARYGQKIIAVLSVDIDLFKFINEAYGFTVGDDVLKAIGKRLADSIREGDTIARLGSDDFGIILFDVAHTDDIILVVKKIMENISHPIRVHGEEIVLTATLGISAFPFDGDAAAELMKASDIALAQAKHLGRNSYQFYTKDMHAKAAEFVSIDKRLLTSFKNREFMLYYQPYWDSNDQKMVGMEALLRWNSTEHGIISPGKFLSVLEDTGMIIEVGDWIINAVCRQLQEWQAKGYAPVPVSINLSSVQFRKVDLADKIIGAIDDYGIDPKFITLEITESSFMKNVEFTSLVLKKLKDRGISVSLDDFGTGYSSLSYLKKFPFDNLKIDISFVKDLTIESDATSLVSAIIAMAHSLNLKTIAEGVETEDLWKILRLLKCDMVQGDYFSPPLPPQGVEIHFER